MKIKDKDIWQKCKDNNKDPYGNAINVYAEKWADLMEEKIAAGATIKDCAHEASRAADTDGITGFMYGAAVQTLSWVWEHGEELRRWHNKDLEPNERGNKANESGVVLNPALLTIEV